MSEEILQTVLELKEISDVLYKGFKFASELLEDAHMYVKIRPGQNRGSPENYVKGFVSEFILKKFFGGYSK